jgi:osmotically-inducible protein OsmY
VNARVAAAMLAALLAFTSAGAQEKHQEKGAGFNDAVITELVTSALEKDPVLRRMNIAVETLGGVVRLSGSVDSMAQVDRAGDLARGIEGVSGVRNTIRVTSRPSRASAGREPGMPATMPPSPPT